MIKNKEIAANQLELMIKPSQDYANMIMIMRAKLTLLVCPRNRMKKKKINRTERDKLTRNINNYTCPRNKHTICDNRNINNKFNVMEIKFAHAKKQIVIVNYPCLNDSIPSATYIDNKNNNISSRKNKYSNGKIAVLNYF